MQNTIKVSDLTIPEFKSLIRETIIETLKELYIPDVDDAEQKELEAMFGKKPIEEEYVYEKEIEI
jgi:hypothetical protein